MPADPTYLTPSEQNRMRLRGIAQSLISYVDKGTLRRGALSNFARSLEDIGGEIEGRTVPFKATVKPVLRNYPNLDIRI